jgi:transcriptional regulator with XRE-family HTH domain
MVDGSNAHMSLGQCITDARNAMRWTQEDLAKKSGIHPTAISHFERGARVPTVANATTLCRTLRISADHLLGLESPHRILSAKLRSLAEEAGDARMHPLRTTLLEMAQQIEEGE